MERLMPLFERGIVYVAQILLVLVIAVAIIQAQHRKRPPLGLGE